MDEQKQKFIKESILLFKKIKADATGKWGKMNAQQMVEHVSLVFAVSTGKIKLDLTTPEEHLPKYMEFLYSDKVFRENTKAPVELIGDEPHSLRFKTMEAAFEDLEGSIQDFENYFKENTGAKIMHPVFGELNYEEWILMHYKHVTHHLRQFNAL